MDNHTKEYHSEIRKVVKKFTEESRSKINYHFHCNPVTYFIVRDCKEVIAMTGTIETARLLANSLLDSGATENIDVCYWTEKASFTYEHFPAVT